MPGTLGGVYPGWCGQGGYRGGGTTQLPDWYCQDPTTDFQGPTTGSRPQIQGPGLRYRVLVSDTGLRFRVLVSDSGSWSQIQGPGMLLQGPGMLLQGPGMLKYSDLWTFYGESAWYILPFDCNILKYGHSRDPRNLYPFPHGPSRPCTNVDEQ